jgi:hypothetical protein
MNSNVIAVAGLPGSGKSQVMDELMNNGYNRYDDINRKWNKNFPKVLSEVKQGLRVAISDILFCDHFWRTRLEEELGVPIQWIFTQNDPWQCAKNCLFRFAFQKSNRPLEREIKFIKEYFPKYCPYGDIRPVPKTDTQIPVEWVSNKINPADRSGR